MNRICILLILFFSLQAQGGNIIGKVTAHGRPEVEGGAGGKYDSKKFLLAPKMDYESMNDFVVYIDEVPKEKPTPPSKPVEVVTQKDATFKPHVLPVVVGTTVQWPNKDEIFHNVFSYSDAKQFDLGIYKNATIPMAVLFDQTGKVDVFCSIHKEMSCIVLVLPTPYFASTDSRKRYVISNVPAGTYRLKAWHERLPGVIKEVVVPENGDVHIDFEMGFGGKK